MWTYIGFILLNQVSVIYKSFSEEDNEINCEQPIFDQYGINTGQHEFEAYLEIFTLITSRDVQCRLIGTEYLSVG